MFTQYVNEALARAEKSQWIQVKQSQIEEAFQFKDAAPMLDIAFDAAKQAAEESGHSELLARAVVTIFRDLKGQLDLDEMSNPLIAMTIAQRTVAHEIIGRQHDSPPMQAVEVLQEIVAGTIKP